MMIIPVSGASNSFLCDKHNMQIFNNQNCVPDFRKKCLSAGKLYQATKTFPSQLFGESKCVTK